MLFGSSRALIINFDSVHLFDTMNLGHFEHLLVEIEAGARGAQCTKSLKPRQVQVFNPFKRVVVIVLACPSC